MNKRELGKEKETAACSYLEACGFFILERNYWTRFGELDIIAKKDGMLVFLEVKYRRNDRYGGAGYSITEKKKQTICRCAMRYLMKHQISGSVPMRFDVLLMEGENITHIPNAFEAVRSSY